MVEMDMLGKCVCFTITTTGAIPVLLEMLENFTKSETKRFGCLKCILLILVVVFFFIFEQCKTQTHMKLKLKVIGCDRNEHSNNWHRRKHK